VGLDLLPFLGISVLLIVVPGPDTAVVMKNALLGGRRAGVQAALGVTLGLAVWTLAAAAGLAALLQASEIAFTALKLVGAAYLVWIGVQLLRTREAAVVGEAAPRRVAGARALRQGLLTDLGNPKVGVFFTSFLPQFLHGDGAAFPALLALGAIFAGLTLAWLAAYGVAVGHAAAFIRRPRVRRALDRITGAVFVGFGVTLALERR
jgi:RhtB (resistance to homoserine/threonine) family protein